MGWFMFSLLGVGTFTLFMGKFTLTEYLLFSIMIELGFFGQNILNYLRSIDGGGRG